jgi:hypothetical protein
MTLSGPLGFTTNAARYVLQPILWLYLAAALLVDRERARGRPAFVAVFAVLALMVVIDNIGVPSAGEQPAVWKQAVDAAKVTCRHGAKEGAMPLEPNPPWSVTLTCEQILH